MNKTYQAHIIKSLEANIRLDGRKNDEFRPIKIELGVSSTAEGSAMITAGDSKIIAGVKMGLGAPYPDSPDSGVLMVSCEMTPLANPTFESGPPSIDSIEISRVIDRGIRESHSFDTKKLCVKKGEQVWMVQVDVVPINFDGNLIDLGGLAAVASLLDAKYPSIDKDGKANYHKRTKNSLKLDQLPIPVTIGKIGEFLIVDPTQEEEEALDARLTITSLEDGTICALQKGLSGTLTFENIKDMATLAISKAKELRKQLLKVVK